MPFPCCEAANGCGEEDPLGGPDGTPAPGLAWEMTDVNKRLPSLKVPLTLQFVFFW